MPNSVAQPLTTSATPIDFDLDNLPDFSKWEGSQSPQNSHISSSTHTPQFYGMEPNHHDPYEHVLSHTHFQSPESGTSSAGHLGQLHGQLNGSNGHSHGTPGHNQGTPGQGRTSNYQGITNQNLSHIPNPASNQNHSHVQNQGHDHGQNQGHDQNQAQNQSQGHNNGQDHGRNYSPSQIRSQQIPNHSQNQKHGQPHHPSQSSGQNHGVPGAATSAVELSDFNLEELMSYANGPYQPHNQPHGQPHGQSHGQPQHTPMMSYDEVPTRPSYSQSGSSHTQYYDEERSGTVRPEVIFTPLISPAVTPREQTQVHYEVDPATHPFTSFEPLTSPALEAIQARPFPTPRRTHSQTHSHTRSSYSGQPPQLMKSPMMLPSQGVPRKKSAVGISPTMGTRSSPMVAPYPGQTPNGSYRGSQPNDPNKNSVSATGIMSDAPNNKRKSSYAAQNKRGRATPSTTPVFGPTVGTSFSNLSASSSPLMAARKATSQSPMMRPRSRAAFESRHEASSLTSTPAATEDGFMVPLPRRKTSSEPEETKTLMEKGQTTFVVMPSPSSAPGSASDQSTPSSAPGQTMFTVQKEVKGTGLMNFTMGKLIANKSVVAPVPPKQVSTSVKPPVRPRRKSSNESEKMTLEASKSEYNVKFKTLAPPRHQADPKKQSHKIAEQGRRNRMNVAIQELYTLLPLDFIHRYQQDKTDKGEVIIPSKATTVEVACDYIRWLRGELAMEDCGEDPARRDHHSDGASGSDAESVKKEDEEDFSADVDMKEEGQEEEEV